MRALPNPSTDPLSYALVQVAGRYAEIINQCVNAAADRHFEALSALLGGQPRLATAARAHVGIKPAAGAASNPVNVRMHTPLAIQGVGEPAIFETLAELKLRARRTNARTVRGCRATTRGGRLADAGRGVQRQCHNVAEAGELCAAYRASFGIRPVRTATNQGADRRE